jgi:hypothetical protein
LISVKRGIFSSIVLSDGIPRKASFDIGGSTARVPLVLGLMQASDPAKLQTVYFQYADRKVDPLIRNMTPGNSRDLSVR